MSVYQTAPAESPAKNQPLRREGSIPRLNPGALDPAVYARSTCWEAGFLISKNAGWRNVRPAIDAQACTHCLNCYMYCPDGTVYKVAGTDEKKPDLAIDYDFCKGCGVCAKACKAGCIAMIPESEA